MNFSKKLVKITLVFVLLIAYLFFAFMVFQPLFARTSGRLEAESVAEDFLATTRPTSVPSAEPQSTERTENTDATEPTEAIPENAELYEAMQAYNETIRADGQTGLCDPWTYTAPALDLSAYGMEKNAVVGVLQIPSIDVTLPIYLGASYTNLDKGAAVLTQTSLPVGGVSTNCVIGAHRGWNAEDYLRDIENVRLGDSVTVTNLWEELQYTVSEIKIIRPDDIDQVRIQEGRELLTVFTCHPYASGGQYRYLLICERVTREQPVPTASEMPTQSENISDTTVPTETSKITPTVCIDGVEFDSAEDEIQIVALLPWIALAITASLFLGIIGLLLKRK